MHSTTTFYSRRSQIAILFMAVLVLAQSSPSYSQEARTFAACGRASDMAAIAASIRGNAPADAAHLGMIGASDVRIDSSISGYRLAGSTSRTLSTVARSPFDDRICAGRVPGPRSVILSSGGAVPGASLASLIAVLDRRATQPSTPFGPAHVDRPDTTIALQSRGKYLFVYIDDYNVHGQGCVGQEAYRVDPSTYQVLPFDGCFDAHAPVPGFLQSGQLPP
jgi:hypothetical protein